MRLAIVTATPLHHAESDGLSRLHRIATSVADRGHDVVCITTKWWKGDFRNFEQDGITYRGVAKTSGGSLTTLLRVASAVRKADPNVVHATCESPYWTSGARLGASFAGAGFLLEWYDPPPTNGVLTGWLRNRALRGADVVITPSETVQTVVREQGIDGRNVDVIPTGVDIERVKAAEPVGNGDIVYSRRLDDGANLETLLLALAEFREYDWTATIIGDGPRREAYERQARDLRIDERVAFVGTLPVEDRIGRFKSAHVYVYTAEYTPFPLDLLRALVAGCVSIVEYQQDSSAHELVVHEDRGFTATSPEELTRKLGEAGTFERRSFDESFVDFSETAFVEAYLEHYNRIQS